MYDFLREIKLKNDSHFLQILKSLLNPKKLYHSYPIKQQKPLIEVNSF